MTDIHKFSVRTTGLSEVEAARLHYMLACAARAFTAEYETSGNVSLEVLRRLYPEDDGWYRSTRKVRIALVT